MRAFNQWPRLTAAGDVKMEWVCQSVLIYSVVFFLLQVLR
jgi:hypothetical protein